MLAVLCRLCETLKLPSPLPTARLERVKSLHTLGVPRVIGGPQVHPVFAAGAETAAVLEACATRALPVGGLTSQVWGRDVFPQYDSALRAERAQKWEVRRPVLTRSAHPSAGARVAGHDARAFSGLRQVREEEVSVVRFELTAHAGAVLPGPPRAR
ncbi:hypothetical protein DIPPA_07400 [Diplonema papillatum]|nr:hypothetical protein DIPPA_07400 [Diplonema papillatum]